MGWKWTILKGLQTVVALYDVDNLQTLCGGRNGCHARKTAVENGKDTTQQDAFDAIIDRLMTENDTME